MASRGDCSFASAVAVKFAVALRISAAGDTGDAAFEVVRVADEADRDAWAGRSGGARCCPNKAGVGLWLRRGGVVVGSGSARSAERRWEGDQPASSMTMTATIVGDGDASAPVGREETDK